MIGQTYLEEIRQLFYRVRQEFFLPFSYYPLLPPSFLPPSLPRSLFSPIPQDEFSLLVEKWNAQRAQAVAQSFLKVLFPQMEKELKLKLLEEAKEHVLQVNREIEGEGGGKEGKGRKDDSLLLEIMPLTNQIEVNKAIA